MMSKDSEWQCEERRCGVVLREVFAWLGGRSLARAGATCRAWRRAAADPPLWRRLLLSERIAEPSALHHLCDLRANNEVVPWRQEYVTACAGWALEARHTLAGGAILLHAALAPAHDVLAVGADDASLTVWRCADGSWREVWRMELRARGWDSVARVEWARHTPRLLLAGPRALIDDWELMVVHLDDDYDGGTIASRVRCSAGAAGCWADAAGDAFLSLELRLVGSGLACTLVRLNAATQETQSEYVGVTAQLLRIFNEDRAHITHVVVATLGDNGEEGRRVLVAGSARRLGAWPVARPRPPPLLAGAPGELAARVRRHRARAPAPDGDAPAPDGGAPEPDEASVRALCAPPDREYHLSAPLVGLVLDDNARWLWVACSDGSVSCVCARTLEAQYSLRSPGGPPRSPAHYVHPSVSDRYVASPEGAYSPRVWIWSLRSAAAAQCGGSRRVATLCGSAVDRETHVQHNGNGDSERDGNGERDRNDEHNVSDDRDGNEQRVGNGNEERDRNDEHDVSDERDDNEQRVGNGNDERDRYNEHDDSDERDGNEQRVGNANDEGDRNDQRYGNDEQDSNGERSVDGEHADIQHSRDSDDVSHNSAGEPATSSDGGDDGDNESNIRAGVPDEGSERGSNEGDGNDECESQFIGNDERESRQVGNDERESRPVSNDESESRPAGNDERGSNRGATQSAQHLGAAVCALLPRADPARALALAGDTLYVWRRRAPAQSTTNHFCE